MDENLPLIRLYYENAKRSVDLQLDAAKHANVKAGVVVGALGIFVAAAGRPLSPGWLNTAWGLAGLMAIGFALIGYGFSRLESGPGPQGIRQEAWGLPEAEATLRVADTYLDSWAKNKPRLAGKLWCVKAALLFFAVAAVMLIAGILMPRPMTAHEYPRLSADQTNERPGQG